MTLGRKTKNASCKKFKRVSENASRNKIKHVLGNDKSTNIQCIESSERVNQSIMNETSEQRESRLSAGHHRSFERKGQNELSLSYARERSRFTRSLETAEHYQSRLYAQRKRSPKNRSFYIEEQYKSRLSMERRRLRLRRSHETEDEQQRRILSQRERSRRIRYSETEEQYEFRLNADSERYFKNKFTETPEHRERRLSAVKKHNSLTIQLETSDERYKRLNNMRASMQERHTPNVNTFKSTIYKFADVPCYICRKMLYPEQRVNLKITNDILNILPQENNSYEKLITCKRCYTNIKKRKVPPQAYWNKMDVALVPEEIGNLTEVEKRMLSRVVPFLRITKVYNRFSQQWCRGQVILFAQDVVEIAEQLPLPLCRAGIIVITENLENVRGQKEFEINIERIKLGLKWLLDNNLLYRDVRTTFSKSGYNIGDIVRITDPADAAKVEEFKNFEKVHSHVALKRIYKINEDISIIRGSFHQGDGRFSLESQGRQCTAVAAVANIAFSLLDVNNWTVSDVDLVVLAGDRYYRDCITNRIAPSTLEVNINYLAVRELIPNFTFCNVNVSIEVQEDISISGNLTKDNSREGFPNLMNGLIQFFNDHPYGILTANAISLAVSCKKYSLNTFYWLFDSHARGPKGYNAPVRGVACCMIFSNINSLHDLIQRNLLSVGNDISTNQYTLTSLIINRQTGSFERQNLLNLRTEGMNSNVIYEKSVDVHDKRNRNLVYENKIIMSTSMLRTIDDIVPDIDTVVSINNGNVENCRQLLNVRRKTVPPLNIDNERRMEELAWFSLFPHGRNGFGEQRDIPISPLDYFQARLMGSDRRFYRNDYLFFALSIVEYFRAKSSVSVSCRMRQDDRVAQNLVDNIHLTMRNIRGSAAYWRRACSELIAMVRSLGPPTWFMTFSCNDLNWPDMLEALARADGRTAIDLKKLSFEERLHLVERFPVVLSRQFMVRVNALLRFLKNDNSVLGSELIDWWYRIEFQNRGSPHLHMLVWCANVPDFFTFEGIDFIERVVSCSLQNYDSTLNELVEKVQIHKHTNTCYKNRDDSECRFGFPRPTSTCTVCLGPEETLSNKGRFCNLKRNENEVMVNNYNNTLLTLWEGNIDIQPCGSVTAVAYYVAKYVSKCEPSDSGDVIREAMKRVKRQGGTLWKQLFSVSMAILSHRLVSAPECAFRLCHLPFKMSSRKAVFINSCKPEQRYRMLRLQNDEASVYNNIFDRYKERPENLEIISLAEFAVRYETISGHQWSEEDGDEELRDYEKTSSRKFITLKDGTRMRIREKPAVLRHRYYTINSDPDAYFYSLIVCHIPFRNESDLLLDGESSENCFLRRQQELRPMQPNLSAEKFVHAEQVIQQALSKAAALLAVNDIDTETETQDEQDLLNNVDDVVVQDINDLNCDVSENRVMSDEVFHNNVRSLNISQRKLFKTISNVIEKEIRNEPIQQLLQFITGGAGSGKSFVLKLIVEMIRRCYAPTEESLCKSIFVEVASLTGVAARQICGRTLHSVFALPIEKGRSTTFRTMSGQRLEQERRKWRKIKWLIIDEISMVSYENLRHINLRLQEFKNNVLLFGGVNILLFGDLMQLPPVNGHWCFERPPWFDAEIHLWQQFAFSELTINMRQNNDAEFVDILNNLRFGQLTNEQLEVLCERRRVPLTGVFEDGVAVRIFPTVKLVDEYNSVMTRTLIKSKCVYIVNANDESQELATYGKKPPGNVIPVDANKCGGLLTTIQIAEGSRVMLRRNISISEGLVNGTMGIIKEFQWPSLRRNQLEEGEMPDFVRILFDDPTVGTSVKDERGLVAICPVTTTFQANRGYGNVERRMLPLILSWAVTVHKLQGTTHESAVIDLGKKLFAKGQAYVALSRVKSLDGLALCELEPSKLLKQPHDQKAFFEMERLRNL